MGTHILEIVVMLLIAAILGFLIAWFWRKYNYDKLNNKINELEKELKKQKDKTDEKYRDLQDCLKKNEELENKVPETDEEIALKRIKEKAKDINFERIGTAQEEEKDDLKIISGIGPFIEKKLNVLGIYTYRQIANFTEEDREKVNEAIEFFPGRIMRDDWIGQA
ncbi:MAG: hypothetical protein L3J74_03475, partial [Bacteroidales bacterium]|nr:hypothetical protein [Bacteroidales bacterium]